MAKQSAADKLIARINADLDRVYAVTNYVGGDGSEKLTARTEADIARLIGMRDYVTGRGVEQAAAEAVKKRTRKPRTRATDAPEDEAARMAV